MQEPGLRAQPHEATGRRSGGWCECDAQQDQGEPDREGEQGAMDERIDADPDPRPVVADVPRGDQAGAGGVVPATVTGRHG